MNLIELNMDKIIALCKKYKVSKLFVFGSSLTNRFNKESDVDFIVNFDKAQVTDYFSNFFDLKYALEDILGREVDLLEEHAIRNHYLNIDWAWVIEEDGIFKFKGKEYEVKTGDVVFVLYASYNRSDDDRDIAIIKSEELYNNFKRNLEYEKNRHNECCEACSPSDC